MFSDFGKINDMTKSQFKTAIEYYQNKIKMLNEDTSISDRSKAWFLERYGARIKSLEETLNTLNMGINTARSRGTLVDENTITLTKLSLSSSATGNFDNLAQDQHKHRVSQRWKILGAILLPVVGTIPFLVSWKRAKKRNKEIDTRLAQENIELGNFMSHERRPYETTLLTSTKFTDAEMANLLEDPTELGQIEALALTGAISPVEKANLTKKLVEVREYGQKNGYNMSATLTDPAFKTKTDKTDSQVSAHESTYNGTPASATNLKAAYDAIKVLETLRGQVQTLYNDTNDKRLETLLANIDARIDTLKANAKTAIENGVNQIVGNINGVTITASPPTESDYTTAISDVDTASKAANANFGPGITAAQALTMANELGFDDQTPEHKKFGEIEDARRSKSTDFEKDLNELKASTALNTEINDKLTLLRTHLNSRSHFLRDTLNDTNIQGFKRILTDLNDACNFLRQNSTSLTPAQIRDLDRYVAVLTTEPRISQIEEKYLEFISKPENFPTYENTITNTIFTDADPINTLTTNLQSLEQAHAIISNTEYKERMVKLDYQFGPKIDSLVLTATQKIAAAKDLIAIKTNSQNIQNQITIYDGQIPTTIPTDKGDLAVHEAALQEIIDWIKNVDATKIDGTTKTNLTNLRTKALKAQAQVSAALSVETLEDIAKEVNERFTTISKSSNNSIITNSLRDLSRLKKKLARMRPSASTSDQSIIDNLTLEIDDLLNGHPLAPGP